MSEGTAERTGAQGAGVAAPMPTQARWGAPRCGYHANAFVFLVASRFLWAGYGLVWLAALYFFVCIGRARRASMHYLDLLRESAGGKRRGVVVRWWQTYRHMVEYGVLLLDRSLMLARPGHGFKVDCEGLTHLKTAMAGRDKDGTERGTVLLTAHFGMAEITAPYMAEMGMDRPFHIVMYQDLRDGTEAFHARYRRMLTHIGVISTTDPLAAGVKIIGALKKGDVVAMRADRTLAGKTVEVDLLGRRVVLPAGPFLAGNLSGARVLYLYAVRMGYRHYRCMISPAAAVAGDAGRGEARDSQIARAAQDFANHLEGVLRRFPYQWANFFDLWEKQKAQG